MFLQLAHTKLDVYQCSQVARGSVIEIDSAIGIAHKLSYASLEKLQSLGNLIVKTFKLLSGMIG